MRPSTALGLQKTAGNRVTTQVVQRRIKLYEDVADELGYGSEFKQAEQVADTVGSWANPFTSTVNDFMDETAKRARKRWL